MKNQSTINALDLAFRKMKLSEVEENKRLFKKCQRKIKICVEEIQDLKHIIVLQSKKIDELKEVILDLGYKRHDYYSDD